MGWTYYIYTPLTIEEIQKLEAQYSESFSEFLSQHPELAESEESTGMVFVGGAVPSVDEVVTANSEFEMEVAPTILDRLKKCRTVIEIEDPVSPESSRLQVTTLRFLLERAKESVMDWGDYQLQLGEKALAKIKRLESFGIMGEARPKTQAKPEGSKELPGEFRAKRIVHLYQLAEENHELAIDLQKLIQRQAEVIQRYMAHLFANGPVGDAEAAKGMGIDLKMLLLHIDKLEKALQELVED